MKYILPYLKPYRRRIALAMLLVKGCGRLWVTREGEAPGVLDFDGLMTFFREGEANGS